MITVLGLVHHDDDLLREQRRFYRARAPEYDEWWQRRGRYDWSDDETVSGTAR